MKRSSLLKACWSSRTAKGRRAIIKAGLTATPRSSSASQATFKLATTASSRSQCYKTFTSVIYKVRNMLECLFLFRPIQNSLMFVVKAKVLQVLKVQMIYVLKVKMIYSLFLWVNETTCWEQTLQLNFPNRHQRQRNKVL